ncbi:MAG: T9SS type A sorting domain-containing protein [Bacteroidales bacterium]|nr:T9SS type A sorting domain-containing protein [Bacteroidales bacterium]
MQRMLRTLFTVIFSLFFAVNFSVAQIYEPDGLRMPGTWNDWTNNTDMEGDFTLVKVPYITPRWVTGFLYTEAATSELFKFVSTGFGDPWFNQWAANENVQLNTLNDFIYGSPSDPNNIITLTSGKYYTVVFEDSGYDDTRAVFMETPAEPVDMISVSVPGEDVGIDEPVQVTVELSELPSDEEVFYIRYTTSGWELSSVSELNLTGTSGTATIPGQPEGSIVNYYAFSSIMSGLSDDIDLYTLKLNNNNGAFYSYQVEGVLPSYPVTFTLTDLSESYTNIHFKGEMTNWDTTPMIQDPDFFWSLTLELDPGSYEWGAVEDDGSEYGLWLIDGPNLVVTVDYDGNVSGETSYIIPETGAGTDPVIAWANLHHPPQGSIQPESTFMVYAQAYIESMTGENAGQEELEDLSTWIGYSTSDATSPDDFSDGWTWIPATLDAYDPDFGNNSQYSVDIGSGIAEEGTYYYVSRFRLADDEYVYGGYSQQGGGFWDGTDNVSGWLVVEEEDHEVLFPVSFSIIDLSESYSSIHFKGEMTGWETIPMNEDPAFFWSLTLEVAPGTYQWGVVEDDGSPDGIWLIEGPNLVVSIDQEGNVSGDVSYTISTTSIYNVAGHQVLVYPNPASDVITVEAGGLGAKIIIRDLNGRVVKEARMQATTTSLSVDHLPTGSYFLEIQYGNESHLSIIIKK